MLASPGPVNPGEMAGYALTPARARARPAPERARAGFTKVAGTVNGNSGYLVSSRELVVRVELMALVTAPGWARSVTRSVLGHWAMPADTVSVAELLASELVTNAVKFAVPVFEPVLVPRAEIVTLTLTLTKLPRRLVIEVADPDSNPPLLTDADADAESGRGLLLVQALSKEWSYRRLRGGGKAVYCVIGISDQASSSAREPL